MMQWEFLYGGGKDISGYEVNRHVKWPDMPYMKGNIVKSECH